VGAPGVVTGVNEFDALEADPVPVPFVAVTVNVYAVPLVRPVTVMGAADAPVIDAVTLLGVEVAV
jgi:hypothetical protein